MSSKKVKQQQLINTKICDNCFAPTHIKFNFSFISYDENVDNEIKAKLIDRIRELSSVPYLEMAAWRKDKGLEFERVDIKKNIANDFFKGNSHRQFNDGKYAIFRLYPNNNPKVVRVIGRLINKVFYIFFIDVGGNLYKH